MGMGNGNGNGITGEPEIPKPENPNPETGTAGRLASCGRRLTAGRLACAHSTRGGVGTRVQDSGPGMKIYGNPVQNRSMTR